MPTVAIDLDIEIVQVIKQLRMNALNVIALVERVDRGLPIAVPLDRDISGQCHAWEVVGVEMLRNRREILGERAYLAVEAEPDEPAPDIAG